jgi:nucleoside-diphosphate-sugar epimerase
MVVSILGCGWYGKALAAALLKKGIIVKASATSTSGLEHLHTIGVQPPYIIKFNADSEAIDPHFFDCDIMVVSISPKLKSGEGESYRHKIQRIIKTCVQYQVKKVIYISSTGVYGEHNSEVNELNEPKPDTRSGAVLLEAESLFQKELAFKTTIIRFGGLIGPGRHPGRFFAGKNNIPNGLAPVNLIHQLDCVAITMAVIGRDVFDYLFNAVSPDHPAKSDYYREMADMAGLPLPEFVSELKSWKIVNSINLSKILGYEFSHQHLKEYTFDAVG